MKLAPITFLQLTTDWLLLWTGKVGARNWSLGRPTVPNFFGKIWLGLRLGYNIILSVFKKFVFFSLRKQQFIRFSRQLSSRFRPYLLVYAQTEPTKFCFWPTVLIIVLQHNTHRPKLYIKMFPQNGFQPYLLFNVQ